MLNWFKKKAPIEEVRHAPLDEPLVHYVFERKRMPDEGASSYAFETLQLAVHSPIDGAVRVRYRNGGSSIGVAFPLAEQQYVGAAVNTNGIPSMAGGMYHARQFTPEGAMADLGSPSGFSVFGLQTNNPAQGTTDASNSAFLNNPFPQGGGGMGSAPL
jgi:hypothetical protein